MKTNESYQSTSKPSVQANIWLAEIGFGPFDME